MDLTVATSRGLGNSFSGRLRSKANIYAVQRMPPATFSLPTCDHFLPILFVESTASQRYQYRCRH